MVLGGVGWCPVAGWGLQVLPDALHKSAGNNMFSIGLLTFGGCYVELDGRAGSTSTLHVLYANLLKANYFETVFRYSEGAGSVRWRGTVCKHPHTIYTNLLSANCFGRVFRYPGGVRWCWVVSGGVQWPARVYKYSPMHYTNLLATACFR